MAINLGGTVNNNTTPVVGVPTPEVYSATNGWRRLPGISINTTEWYYPSSLPDLIPTSLSYNSTTHLFTSVVKNQGAAATPAGVVIGVAYLVDGVQCTWGSVNGPLAAGASVTIASNGGACKIASGKHTITAFADDVNRIAESNKNNNKLSKTITVP